MFRSAALALTLCLATAAAQATPPEPYNLVGWYQRNNPAIEGFGVLSSRMFKAGAAQGCPGPVYSPPCYSPASAGGWTAAQGIIATVSAAAPTWTWDGTTLTEAGLFWVTSFVSSNPGLPSVISDKVTAVTITITSPGAGFTSAATYECVEGNYSATVGTNGCKAISLGANMLDDTTTAWNVGGNAFCVTQTISFDDISFTGGSPRGLTAQTVGQAGAGCSQTSGGIYGPSGAFDLWHVIRDDGTYLILANAPNIGQCYLFGSGTGANPCPVVEGLSLVSYLLLARPDAPDTDGDGNLDGFDNCGSDANPDQRDLPDGDGIGDVCDTDVDNDGALNGADNCPLNTNPTQADFDGDGRGDNCDNCKLLANTLAGDVPGTSPPVPKYQLDSDGDGYGNRCDGDVSNTQASSGQVNTTDYSILRSVINKVYSFSVSAAKSDLNGDGVVNTTDYSIFRTLINKVPGPSAYCGPLPSIPSVTCPPVP